MDSGARWTLQYLIWTFVRTVRFMTLYGHRTAVLDSYLIWTSDKKMLLDLLIYMDIELSTCLFHYLIWTSDNVVRFITLYGYWIVKMLKFITLFGHRTALLDSLPYMDIALSQCLNSLPYMYIGHSYYSYYFIWASESDTIFITLFVHWT